MGYPAGFEGGRMVRTKDPGGSALERLREFGLRYPGAHTKSPWPGHLDLAVNDKTFAYLSIAGEPLKISCKLPRSADAALELPFTTPTAYGLGKSGWVTATFPDDAPVPVDLLEEWIDESYRAQAPKRLSARLPAFGARTAIDGEPDGERDDDAPATPAVASPRAARRSTVKRESAGVPATPPRATERRATNRPTKRAAAAPASRAKAKAKAKGAAGGATQRQPARAASASGAKRAGVSPRATKRPAKKRARPRA
jgi:predicted DNA-binding protein (MmcQ/YjbR family)